ICGAVSAHSVLAGEDPVIIEYPIEPEIEIFSFNPETTVYTVRVQTNFCRYHLDTSNDLSNWILGGAIFPEWELVSNPNLNPQSRWRAKPALFSNQLAPQGRLFYRLRAAAPEPPSLSVSSISINNLVTTDIVITVDSGIGFPTCLIEQELIEGPPNTSVFIEQGNQIATQTINLAVTNGSGISNLSLPFIKYRLVASNAYSMSSVFEFSYGTGGDHPVSINVSLPELQILPKEEMIVLQGCVDLTENIMLQNQGSEIISIAWTGPEFLAETLSNLQTKDLIIPASALIQTGTYTLTLTINDKFGQTASQDFTLTILPTEPLTLTPEGETELSTFNMSPVTLSAIRSHTPCQNPNYEYNWQVLDAFGIDVGVAPPFDAQTSWDLGFFDFPPFGETWEYTLTVTDLANSGESASLTWLVSSQ
ncbi:MAG: hypothetical protein AAGC74_03625, partial [Verrucomicrobiota bacterium]